MRSLAAACVIASLVAFPRAASAQDAQAQLWDAAVAGDTVAIIRALQNGAEVNALDTRQARNGRRALNWAALNNHVPAIRVLLAAGAGIDSSNYTGFTALHHAAELGALEAAEALLRAGADPHQTNRAGQKPAAVARERGFTSVATLLEAAERGEPPPTSSSGLQGGRNGLGA